MSKLFDLTGKVCVVTGANRGIGYGMAEGLLEHGAKVVIWGSKADRNAEAVKTLAPLGVIKGQVVDVSDEAQVVKAMAEVNEEFGRVDTVIANAGASFKTGSILETTTETWRKTTAVNLDGAFWTLREGAKYMVERAKAGDPGGSLVGTASMGALFGTPYNEAYSASKAGLIMLIKGMAVELARYGVRANAVLPGWVATEMTSVSHKNDKFNDRVIGRVPQRRWGHPEEFKGVAVYLASNASSFHNGDAILIDGGYAAF